MLPLPSIYPPSTPWSTPFEIVMEAARWRRSGIKWPRGFPECGAERRLGGKIRCKVEVVPPLSSPLEHAMVDIAHSTLRLDLDYIA